MGSKTPFLEVRSNVDICSIIYCPILFKGTGIPGPSEPYHGASLQPNSVPTLPVSGPVDSASQPQPVPPVGVPPIIEPCQSGTKGSDSSYFSGVMEWTFSASQSDIQCITGSNACVFIALLMGKLSFERNLTWPTSDLLPESWKGALHEAMIKGNQIHDDLFDKEATNVTVDEADSLAGEECGVQSLGQQIDIFGIAPINQLSNWLMQEAQNKSKSYYVIVADERAFLLAMNGDQSAMIVESHRHGSKGAIIACCQRGHVGSFALWFDAMMSATWGVSLTIASISPVYY